MAAGTKPSGLLVDAPAHDSATFARVASAWFLGLAGLYVLYVSSTFLGPETGISVTERLVMVFGPTTVALSLLISPAVFVAALERFHPFAIDAPTKRTAHWGPLALSALAAGSISALGPHIATSLLPIPQISIPEDALVAHEALATTQSLIPVAIGLLTLCSGVTGALIGHATMHWRATRRNATRWLACLALIVSFLLPLLIATNLIRLGVAPAYWIVAGPLAIPAILVGTLTWRLHTSLGLSFVPPKKRDIIDAENLDRIVTAVIEADEHPERPFETLANSDLELEMAHLAAGVRREVAGSVRISESRVHEILQAMLEASPAGAPKAATPTAVLDTGGTGVFVTSWACLAAGLAMVSALGGVPPSLLSALGAGLLGSVAVTLIARRSPTISDTVPI